MTELGLAPGAFLGGPSIHTLRIELLYVEPMVWRRFVAPSEVKLPPLYGREGPTYSSSRVW